MLPDASTPMPGEPAVALFRWSALALDGHERSTIIGHGGQELFSSTCVSTHDALTRLPTQGDHLPTHAQHAASQLTRPASHWRAFRRMSATHELHGKLLLRVGCRDEPHDAKGSRCATSAPASLPSRLAARGHPAAELGPAGELTEPVSMRTGDDQGAVLYDGTHAARSIKGRGVRGSTFIYYQQKHSAIRQHACGGWDGLGMLARGLQRSGQCVCYAPAKLRFRACVAASANVVFELVRSTSKGCTRASNANHGRN